MDRLAVPVDAQVNLDRVRSVVFRRKLREMNSGVAGDSVKTASNRNRRRKPDTREEGASLHTSYGQSPTKSLLTAAAQAVTATVRTAMCSIDTERFVN
ncbi:hypothetical protein BN903_84 [Halorubrum sp. AJ67]|nr:hypothetical protein BN903_84 [Halorubrum sp. AJ67]